MLAIDTNCVMRLVHQKVYKHKTNKTVKGLVGFRQLIARWLWSELEIEEKDDFKWRYTEV